MLEYCTALFPEKKLFEKKLKQKGVLEIIYTNIQMNFKIPKQ